MHLLLDICNLILLGINFLNFLCVDFYVQSFPTEGIRTKSSAHDVMCVKERCGLCSLSDVFCY